MQDMEDVYTQLMSIPVVMAVVTALKIAGTPTQFLPLVSIAVGAATGGLVYLYTGAPISFLMGLLVGVAASGSYDAAKSVISAVRK